MKAKAYVWLFANKACVKAYFGAKALVSEVNIAFFPDLSENFSVPEQDLPFLLGHAEIVNFDFESNWGFKRR